MATPSVSVTGSDLARLRPVLDEPWPEYDDLSCPDDGGEDDQADGFDW